MTTETDKQIAERVLNTFDHDPGDLHDLASRLLAADAKRESQQGSAVVKRYTCDEELRGDPMFEDKEGDWVTHEDHVKAMRARVPGKYVLVPKNPTEKMRDIFNDVVTDCDDFDEAYRQMCAAAPKPE